jgi:uncharacterized protein
MPPLSNEDKRFLLQLARASLEAAVSRQRLPEPQMVPAHLREIGNAFVTLRRGDELRGCVGYIELDEPLYKVIIDSAAAAALRDFRFLPVSPTEAPGLQIEISVLSAPHAALPEEIEVGVHGIIVTQGRFRGLLLPQVATERDWTATKLLQETCKKAGLPADCWRQGAKIEVFTAEIFSEGEEPHARD